MSLQKILRHWEVYNRKKVNTGTASRYFLCNDNWEIDFLTSKIKTVYPWIHEMNIREAIKKSCNDLQPKYPRKKFVSAVLKKLNIHLFDKINLETKTS